jgi:hypothetical protein
MPVLFLPDNWGARLDKVAGLGRAQLPDDTGIFISQWPIILISGHLQKI